MILEYKYCMIKTTETKKELDFSRRDNYIKEMINVWEKQLKK
jgi:hypothetical protein